MAKQDSNISAPQGLNAGLARKMRRRRETLQQLNETARHVPAPRNDLSPVLRIARVPIVSLRPAARRIRRSDPVQVERVAASICKFGISVPLVITGDHQIVHGHSVWEAAKKLGIEEVSCVLMDHLTQTEARALSIALNRLGERGSWDLQELQIEFEELLDLGEDLVVGGFEMPEIDMILSSEDPPQENDLEPVLAKIGTPTSRSGDVWILGRHKLIQGDARDTASYVRLMNGEAAQLVLTDVPYNISVRTITKNEAHREFAMASGELSREEFVAFNKAWMGPASAKLVDGGLLSTAIDWRTVDVVMQAARELGLDHINTCIWTKTNAGQGSLWRSAHEEYPFFRKGKVAHVNNVELGRHGRWRSNVWGYPGASTLGSDSREGLDLHPTVKPRALLADVMLDVTNRDDVVIDCFAGSGSTVLAAEETGRRCMAIEIDAAYCDVTIERWQQLTGEAAVLKGDGESFVSLTEARRGNSA